MQITKTPKLSPVAEDAHKGILGKVLIIGGSVGMSGAPALAGMAALRSGSGLVRIAVPSAIQPTVAGYNPCYTTVSLAADDTGRISEKAIGEILEAVNKNDVIALGPGIGISNGIREIISKLITMDIKLVIDADGLNNLAVIYNWHKIAKAQLILTPHPGEMKKLWQSVLREQLPDDRILTAVKFAQMTKAVTVLKGKGTVVAHQDDFYVNTTGNPGMATAGSGDVLTGMTASLWGQGLSALNAAVLAVYEHGNAGDKAAQIKGKSAMIASDIIENIKF